MTSSAAVSANLVERLELARSTLRTWRGTSRSRLYSATLSHLLPLDSGEWPEDLRGEAEYLLFRLKCDSEGHVVKIDESMAHLSQADVDSLSVRIGSLCDDTIARR